MRSVWVATAAALVATGGADAQRMVMAGPGAGYPAPAPGYPPSAPGYPPSAPGYPSAGAAGPAPVAPSHAPVYGSRWGSRVDGRWWAGANAPGGWRAYRTPVRGWTLPGYWRSPGFAIADWQGYGLGDPPAGYGWTRYYDDAVLVDGRGRVYDSVAGIDWDRGYAGGSYYAGDDAVYAAPAQRGYADGRYGAYPAQSADTERRSSGVGGALVGAAAGGVAGNLIAGRGNRLAGTLIGAGVGGAAGYAIDRSQTRRVPVAPRGYDYPPPAAIAPPPPPPSVPSTPTCAPSPS